MGTTNRTKGKNMDKAAHLIEQSFTVHCGYCAGWHTAKLDEATIGQPYGPLYNVYCADEGIRWGVHASTERRIS